MKLAAIKILSVIALAVISSAASTDAIHMSRLSLSFEELESIVGIGSMLGGLKCGKSIDCFYVTRPISYERCSALNKLPSLKSPAVTNENLKQIAVMAETSFWAFDVNTVDFQCVKMYAGNTYVVPAVAGENYACLLAFTLENGREIVEHHFDPVETLKYKIHTISEHLVAKLYGFADDKSQQLKEATRSYAPYVSELLDFLSGAQSFLGKKKPESFAQRLARFSDTSNEAPEEPSSRIGNNQQYLNFVWEQLKGSQSPENTAALVEFTLGASDLDVPLGVVAIALTLAYAILLFIIETIFEDVCSVMIESECIAKIQTNAASYIQDIQTIKTELPIHIRTIGNELFPYLQSIKTQCSGITRSECAKVVENDLNLQIQEIEARIALYIQNIMSKCSGMAVSQCIAIIQDELGSLSPPPQPDSFTKPVNTTLTA